MSAQIMVSIICNTYNHEPFIRDALEGFVRQETDFAFEILIHDDASTDRTAEIIREYEKQYPDLFFPIYETENQYSKHDGTIRRLQEARVRGAYVALCEGDDHWTDPQKLQKQYDFMRQHPDYTLCGCSTVWINMLTGKEMENSKTDVDRDVPLSELINPSSGYRPFPYVSFFVKTNIWKDLPKWGFPVGDLPLTYYAAMNGRVRMLADTMCVYRWNVKGSWTARNERNDKRAETEEQMIKAFERMNEDTGYIYDEIIKKAIVNKKYTLAIRRHDFKAIRGPELIGKYKGRKPIKRLSDRLRCTMPIIYEPVQYAIKMIGRHLHR